MSIVYENKAAKAKVERKDVPYPEYMTIAKPPYRPQVSRVPVDRFFKQEYHDLEIEKIWKKAWQWACREDEIPEIGDHYVYEVADLSFIVVRTGPEEIKAYWNSCLHRGRKLKEFNGKRATEFRCMFHGWSWDINGAMNDMTCGWDFPGTRTEVGHLPEAKVGTWGGFVFINPDLDCEPLADFLGELPQHFEHSNHDFKKRWKQVHVLIDLPVNWKIVQEAFLESWHVTHTHPQLLAPTQVGGSEGRWDDFGNWMRHASSLPTDPFKSPPNWVTKADDDQQWLDQYFDSHLNEEPALALEENRSPIETLTENLREYYRTIIGDKTDEYHDVHIIPGEMISVWPNFHPWGGFSRIVYRFRPHKDGPNRSLTDVVLLAPWPEDRPMPPPAPIHVLGPNEPIEAAPELGILTRIFMQDIGNMTKVHEGLKTSRQGYVLLGSHNEAPVRKFHDMYDKWMGLEGEQASSDNKDSEA
jgi:nitrite reductase/ring-hydroxylating ferredoxin subunit